jgi:hypothetical protein
MNSKTKTFLALTVKLLFSINLLHAQASRDSAKQTIPHFLPAYYNAVPLKQQAFQNTLPGNFYAKQLPFFCSKELQVQKAVGIPVKFRLSTVEYCDKLEGKNR